MKIITTILLLFLLAGAASAAWYPQKVNVPVTNYDNITLVDDKFMFFGTGTDAAISYDSSMDKLYFNDTPLYLEEAVTMGSTVSFSGAPTFTSAADFDNNITQAANKGFTQAAGTGWLTVGTTGISATSSPLNILENLTMASAKSIAMSGASTFTSGTGTFDVNGAMTSKNITLDANYNIVTSGTGTITSAATISGEQLTSTDDALVTDDLIVDGLARVDESLTANSLVVNTTSTLNGNTTIAATKRLVFGAAGSSSYLEFVAGNYLSIKGNPQMDDGFTWAGVASPSSASDLNAIGGASDINYTLSSGILVTPTGAATFQGNNTVAANKALAVTTADKLTVGGKIIPQEMVLTFPYTASSVDQQIFTAKEAWNITAVRLVPRVVGGDASPVNVTVTVCDDAEAPASGVAALSAVLDLKGTADTIQSGTLNATNVAVASGDSVAVNFTGTLTSAVGVVTVYLKRV